jgi:hypothetical protein
MDPNRRSDRILEEWNAVSGTVRRPAAAPRPQTSGIRAGLGLAGAGLLAAALVVAVAWLGQHSSTGVGGLESPSPSASAVAVAPSPSPVTPRPSASEPESSTTPSCALSDLSARITAWDGAAGHRIASVSLTSHAAGDCVIAPLPVPALVDGSGRVLAAGTGVPAGAPLTLRPGEVVRTEVDVSNVCGAAPVAPVTVAFDMGGGRPLVAEPLTANDTTVPPCNGPSLPASIQMHPWSR